MRSVFKREICASIIANLTQFYKILKLANAEARATEGPSSMIQASSLMSNYIVSVDAALI